MQNLRGQPEQAHHFRGDSRSEIRPVSESRAMNGESVLFEKLDRNVGMMGVKLIEAQGGFAAAAQTFTVWRGNNHPEFRGFLQGSDEGFDLVSLKMFDDFAGQNGIECFFRQITWKHALPYIGINSEFPHVVTTRHVAINARDFGKCFQAPFEIV